MARVFRPTYTIPIPDGAERLERDGKPFVRFRHKGRVVTAPVTTKGRHAGTRTLVEAGRWAVEYVGAGGRPRRKTGFTDKRATEAMAEGLQKAVDRERAGIIDRQSVDRSKAMRAAIDEHVAAYKAHLQAANVSDWHLSETSRRLNVLLTACGIQRLADIKAEPVNRWCNARSAENMGARTRNTYIGSLRAFVRWCVADGRIDADPLTTLTKANEDADRRRMRRALTDDELTRLVAVAELRPVAEFGRPKQDKDKAERRGTHDTWIRLPLDRDSLAECAERGREALHRKPEYMAKLERLGKERGLIYRTLVLTGLRRGELAAMTWGDLALDGAESWLTVRASVAKSGAEATIPLRSDLADDLRAWRKDLGKPKPTARVFTVPTDLVRILKRDLEAAGIDGTGVDVHALRHTTATFLAKAGVAPRTAQEIMRHSDIRLTLGTYTDPRALNVRSALDALPSFKADRPAERMRATGTYDSASGALGVQLGGIPRPRGQNGSIPSNNGDGDVSLAGEAQLVVVSTLSNDEQRDSTQRATRLERATFSLEG